jgi:hypothetical protein
MSSSSVIVGVRAGNLEPWIAQDHQPMSNAPMQVHGACHCGAVTYEAAVNAEQVTICHCTDCQRLTGSAYRVSVPAQIETFRLTSGEPKIYFKVGDSGRKRAQAFCSNCGSPLYTYGAENPRTYGLRVGCIRERHALVPQKRIWCRSTLEWCIDLHGMQERERE